MIMSRIGKLPITIPWGVEVKIHDREIVIKWPKGELKYNFLKDVIVEVVENDKNKQIEVELNEWWDVKFWWLTRSLIANMVEWVTKWYEKKLMVLWVWFGAKLEWNKLVLSLGLSHKVNYEWPKEVKITAEKAPKWEDILTITWIDKQKVWEIASKIRSFKKPEVYKWKWIRYIDEVIKLKAWKTWKK